MIGFDVPWGTRSMDGNHSKGGVFFLKMKFWFWIFLVLEFIYFGFVNWYWDT